MHGLVDAVGARVLDYEIFLETLCRCVSIRFEKKGRELGPTGM